MHKLIARASRFIDADNNFYGLDSSANIGKCNAM